MIIKKSKLENIPELNKLTYDSKASWGYSEDQMRLWENELKLHTDDIIKNNTYILTDKNNIILGYITYILKDNGKIYLKNLFVHKNHFKKGLGKKLLTFLIQESIKNSCGEIYLESDKYAELFYTKHGFFKYGEKEDSKLPLLKRYL